MGSSADARSSVRFLADDGARPRVLGEKLISLALDGDLGAIGGIADRLDGKPWQVVEHSRRLTLEELVAASFASPATT